MHKHLVRVDELPSIQRQRDLQKSREQNIADNQTPYDNVKINTYGELTWLIQQHNQSSQQERAETISANLDLRGVDLSNTNLTGIVLSNVDLSDASLSGTDLTGANLIKAKLIGADLMGTNLSDADLSGADLRGTVLSSTTKLSDITLTTTTSLCDVQWNNAVLTRIRWSQLHWRRREMRLGDEEFIAHATSLEERLTAIHDAIRAYRVLVVALRQQGLSLPVHQLKLRQSRLEYLAYRLEGNLFKWGLFFLLDIVSGNGQQPSKTFGAYITVVFSFTGLFYLVTNTLDTNVRPLTIDESLVLSLTSFHGRGFFPGSIPLGDWTARVGALEAVIGLFIELCLIAVFTQHFFADV